MTTDADDRITKFSEKPKNPDSTKACLLYTSRCV